jgi:hypothetical protein
MTQTLQVPVPPNTPQLLYLCSKSRANKGHFTLEAKTVFRPYLASSLCSSVTQICPVLLPTHEPQRAVMKGTLLNRLKEFLVPISRLIGAEWLERHMWQSLRIHQNQCKFGRNLAATKDTLRFRPKYFLVSHVSLQRCGSNCACGNPSL